MAPTWTVSKRHVASADALLGWQFPHLDAAKLAPKLSWIQLTGAGVDHLLPLDWLPPHITLTNAKGAHKPKIGEALFMAVLMINNFIPALAHQQRQNRWNQIVLSTASPGRPFLSLASEKREAVQRRWQSASA